MLQFSYGHDQFMSYFLTAPFGSNLSTVWETVPDASHTKVRGSGGVFIFDGHRKINQPVGLYP